VDAVGSPAGEAIARPAKAINAATRNFIASGVLELGERCGSGDGERKTLLTRQIAFEPLPASVLFGLGGLCGLSPCFIKLILGPQTEE
jgi:hypothetical protein